MAHGGISHVFIWISTVVIHQLQQLRMLKTFIGFVSVVFMNRWKKPKCWSDVVFNKTKYCLIVIVVTPVRKVEFWQFSMIIGKTRKLDCYMNTKHVQTKDTQNKTLTSNTNNKTKKTFLEKLKWCYLVSKKDKDGYKKL